MQNRIKAKKGKEKTNEIRVWDRGTGIRSEFQNNIFDPLISHKNNGAGLGLRCAEIFLPGIMVKSAWKIQAILALLF